MRRLVIIGAGISGLTAGVYAARSGFDTLILERTTSPGGVSASWKRKGFTFEGGVHWVTGSGSHLPLNRVWRETGALGAGNPVYNKDPYFVLELPGGGELPLYRDPDRMYRTFVEFAPEDRKAISRLRRHIREFRWFHSPVLDLAGLKATRPSPFRPMEFLRMFPALIRTPYLWSVSVEDYVSHFKNPCLRALLGSIMNTKHNALSYIVTLSSFSYGDCGYPRGGSAVMNENMAETFRKAGGTIRYNTEVSEVLMEGGRPVGVRVGDEVIDADAVLVSSDARVAMDRFFQEPLGDGWARKMRRKLEGAQAIFIGLGVKGDLKDLPRSMVFPLKEPFRAAGLSWPTLIIHNYALDGYAPEGCTTLSTLLLGNTYGFWRRAKEDGLYKERKQEVLDAFVETLYRIMPQLRGKVIVTDVATPATVERYCETFCGSYMAVWPRRTFLPHAPIRYCRGLYFSGQRTSLSGGLPIAVSTGRKAAQYLCRDFSLPFVNE